MAQEAGLTAWLSKVSCVCFGSPALKPCKVLSSPIASLSLPPCFSRGRQRLCDWQYRSHFLHLPDPISWIVKGTNKIYIQKSLGSRATCHTKRNTTVYRKGGALGACYNQPVPEGRYCGRSRFRLENNRDDRHLGNLNAWTTSQVPPPLATPKSQPSRRHQVLYLLGCVRSALVVDRRTGTPQMHIASKGCRPPYYRMCMSPPIS